MEVTECLRQLTKLHKAPWKLPADMNNNVKTHERHKIRIDKKKINRGNGLLWPIEMICPATKTLL
jgi:hypothetical protein